MYEQTDGSRGQGAVLMVPSLDGRTLVPLSVPPHVVAQLTQAQATVALPPAAPVEPEPPKRTSAWGAVCGFMSRTVRALACPCVPFSTTGAMEFVDVLCGMQG